MIILFVVEGTLGLGKVESAQELGRKQGGWVAGPLLTPEGSWMAVGLAQTHRGDYLKRGSGRQSHQGTCGPTLERVP